MSSQKAGDVHNHAQGLASLTAELLKSGRYSDLTITCKGKVFKVHRNIVGVQSKPLAAAFDGGFVEGKTRVIDLAEDDPFIIEKLIHFLYSQEYDDERSTKTATKISKSTFEPSNALQINTALYIAGEKWDVAALKTLAKEKYEGVVSAEWNCTSFASCLELLYAETPETVRLLKDVAIKVAASHVMELVNNRDFADLCKKNGEIGLDVLKAFFSPQSTNQQRAERRCSKCKFINFFKPTQIVGGSQIYHCSYCNIDFV